VLSNATNAKLLGKLGPITSPLTHAVRLPSCAAAALALAKPLNLCPNLGESRDLQTSQAGGAHLGRGSTRP